MHTRSKLALFGAAIALCAATGCARSTPREWPAIELGDFRYLSENNRVRYYVKAEPAAGHPRLLLRMEYLEPTMAEGLQTASAVILTEFDCEKNLSRDLRMTGYPRNNMQGTGKTEQPDDPEWDTVEAIGAIRDLFNIACAKPAP